MNFINQDGKAVLASNEMPRREIKAVLPLDKSTTVFNFLRLNKLGFNEHHKRRVIHSIYFDDNEMSDYFNHVLGLGKRKKNRIRKYNELDMSFAKSNIWTHEIKSKIYEIGHKTRKKSDIVSLFEYLKPSQPRLLVSYSRHYFIDRNEIRVTLDTDIRYTKIILGNNEVLTGRSLGRNLCILEMKVNCSDTLVSTRRPNEFLAMFNFRVEKFSKYCDAVEKLELIDR